MPTTLVIKIMSAAEWSHAAATGVYEGSADDKRDGFIHFSAPAQVRGTAAKYFANRDDLMLVSIDARKLGEALRWEESRGGQLFPHLYAPLTLTAVVKSEPLKRKSDGSYEFPDWLPD